MAKALEASRYAATGSIAGTSVAPPRLAMIYVDDPGAAARERGRDRNRGREPLVAKLHKLAEREEPPTGGLPRSDSTSSASSRHRRPKVAARLIDLETHAIAGPVSGEARVYLERLFASLTGYGAAMAVRASAGLETRRPSPPRARLANAWPPGTAPAELGNQRL